MEHILLLTQQVRLLRKSEADLWEGPAIPGLGYTLCTAS